MKRYGNIPFTRRVVAFVCLLVVAVSVLMPAQIVRADDTIQKSLSFKINRVNADGKTTLETYTYTFNITSDKPVYSYSCQSLSGDFYTIALGFVSSGHVEAKLVSKSEPTPISFPTQFNFTNNFYNFMSYMFAKPSTPFGGYSDLYANGAIDSVKGLFLNYARTGEKGDGLQIGYGSGYLPNTQAYSEIGCLDNVQMETYVTNKKELIDADENADLSKINQDKVIVYSSSTTSGIDLSKGGYKVQLYGSYAWQDKSGNIKSEDKGHKTFIKDWDAQDNIKGLYRSRYHWIDWKSANDKVEAGKTDKAHKPNAFEKMTTYANYQYEPIWYLRIVSQDNKYGAWVKLYNSTNKGKYRSESVDDDDNAVPDSGGGYNKPKDTSEITGMGDTPEDAKNNVPKAEEKQDNDDLNDSANGNNSTFDKLEQFTKGIGDVPKMIADIFSFLPSWCLEVVGIGFALLMILIVVKFIRG